MRRVRGVLDSRRDHRRPTVRLALEEDDGLGHAFAHGRGEGARERQVEVAVELGRVAVHLCEVVGLEDARRAVIAHVPHAVRAPDALGAREPRATALGVQLHLAGALEAGETQLVRAHALGDSAAERERLQRRGRGAELEREARFGEVALCR